MTHKDQKQDGFVQKIRAALLAATAITGTAQATPAAASDAECTYLADPELSRFEPEIARHLQTMKRVPSARLVTEPLQEPQHFVKACLVSSFQRASTQAKYDYLDKALLFTADNSISNVIHEIFHAHQDLGGSLKTVLSPLQKPVLTAQDSYVAHMLIEATAAAYTMIVLKQNEHQDPIEYTLYMQGADSYGMGDLFENTFNQHLKEREKQRLPYAQAEKEALEIAGQAIVREMIFGQNDTWRSNYEAAFFNKVASRDYPLTQGPGYAAMRSDIYTKIGQVTTNFSLTPPEFRTGAIDQTVRSALKTAPMGLGKF